jgi:hypothetical protein
MRRRGRFVHLHEAAFVVAGRSLPTSQTVTLTRMGGGAGPIVA